MKLDRFDSAAGYLPDECFKNPPDLGILLGSGWGEALKIDEVLVRIKYADIPGLGASTVKGHSGEFILYPSCGQADRRVVRTPSLLRRRGLGARGAAG